VAFDLKREQRNPIMKSKLAICSLGITLLCALIAFTASAQQPSYANGVAQARATVL
jgi:hypothetical protein